MMMVTKMMVAMLVVMMPCNKMMIMISGNFPTHPALEQHHSVFCDSGEDDDGACDDDDNDGGDGWYGIVQRW